MPTLQGVVVKQAKIKIILPEGCTDVKVESPVAAKEVWKSCRIPQRVARLCTFELCQRNYSVAGPFELGKTLLPSPL